MKKKKIEFSSLRLNNVISGLKLQELECIRGGNSDALASWRKNIEDGMIDRR